MRLVPLIIALHLGALHPVEKALTLVLAFGPFLLLGLLVWWRHTHPEGDSAEAPDQPR